MPRDFLAETTGPAPRLNNAPGGVFDGPPVTDAGGFPGTPSRAGGLKQLFEIYRHIPDIHTEGATFKARAAPHALTPATERALLSAATESLRPLERRKANWLGRHLSWLGLR